MYDPHAGATAPLISSTTIDFAPNSSACSTGTLATTPPSHRAAVDFDGGQHCGDRRARQERVDERALRQLNGLAVSMSVATAANRNRQLFEAVVEEERRGERRAKRRSPELSNGYVRPGSSILTCWRTPCGNTMSRLTFVQISRRRAGGPATCSAANAPFPAATDVPTIMSGRSPTRRAPSACRPVRHRGSRPHPARTRAGGGDSPGRSAQEAVGHAVDGERPSGPRHRVLVDRPLPPRARLRALRHRIGHRVAASRSTTWTAFALPLGVSGGGQCLRRSTGRWLRLPEAEQVRLTKTSATGSLRATTRGEPVAFGAGQIGLAPANFACHAPVTGRRVAPPLDLCLVGRRGMRLEVSPGPDTHFPG